MSTYANHPYKHILRDIEGEDGLQYFDIYQLAPKEKIDALPVAIRVLLENTVRNCNGFSVTKTDVEATLAWSKTNSGADINYCPARVLLQDFTGVPAVVDLAAMRTKVKELGGNPEKINPQVPTELVIDHSIIVDSAKEASSISKNEELEFERNTERFSFLKWGSQAFQNMSVVPPGNGICHQVNLEYLARGAFVDKEKNIAYPDSVVGTDSHTTMISGLGVLGWGVGGIEAEAVMLGQPYSMALPEIIGFVLTGSMSPACTATDLVLCITHMLRAKGVVGKIVEFVGEGCDNLSVADRATIANMAPEYGATTGFFPPDNNCVDYMKGTGRDEKTVGAVDKYWKVSGINNSNSDKIVYTESLTLDLSTVVPCVTGPKRPQDLVATADLKKSFIDGLTKPVGFSSFGIDESHVSKTSKVQIDGKEHILSHGSVVIAAITSCTNTSNPSVMLGAGLVAKKAVAAGLTVPAYVKTSLSPGSAVVMRYLEESGLRPELESLGFFLAGFGCMTCIGNSGEIHPEVSKAIADDDLVASAVLSGNRNFEGRVHPQTRANYLASPPLVVAYALAGRVTIDFEKEPIATGSKGPVFLRDIWPTPAEVNKALACINMTLYKEVYQSIQGGNPRWNDLKTATGSMYNWVEDSTYVHLPPFFDGMDMNTPKVESIKNAKVLGLFGDSITTDHISPAGKITPDSPAGKWLLEKGVSQRLFNSYGSRRGHDAVMARGTFANVRLVNQLVSKVGPYTYNVSDPKKEEKYFYEVAEEYKKAGQSAIIFAGKFYGSGSSRDWAAKGTYLQSVRAVIAESFERIHRSNLIGMGVLPLEFVKGESASSHKITGLESWNVDVAADGPTPLAPRKEYTITSDKGHSFKVLCRIDTAQELQYYNHGGILRYMIRELCK